MLILAFFVVTMGSGATSDFITLVFKSRAIAAPNRAREHHTASASTTPRPRLKAPHRELASGCAHTGGCVCERPLRCAVRVVLGQW